MKTLSLRAGALALALFPAIAPAQDATSVRAPAGYAPLQAPCVRQDDGGCLAVSKVAPLPTGVRESVQLVAGNTTAAAVTLFGGDYILTQTCTGYGTLTVQARGPDGTAWLTLVTRTASDTGSGTGIALGSYAVVRATVTGTSGCNAVLARVPA